MTTPSSLVILANAFPYGSWEPFLETEINHWGQFDQVVIFSLSVRPAQLQNRRELPGSHVEVYPIAYRSRTYYAVRSVNALLDLSFYRELLRLVRRRRLTLSHTIRLAAFLSRAHHEARVVQRVLAERLPKDSRVVIYAYRFAYQPYLAWLVQRSLRGAAVIVARAHGSDLYEEHAPGRYLPLRVEVAGAVSEVHAVSEHGAAHLRAVLPRADVEKVHVSRLGTRPMTAAVDPGPRNPLRIVTCSALVQVKRLDRLVDALRLMGDHAVVWTHFGGGPLRGTLEAAAREVGKHLEVDFRGEVANDAMLEHFQSEPFHALVNVSESEGVPVSMMEACSVGIPIVATHVGGTGEIVRDGFNGFLVPARAQPEDISAALTRLEHLPDGEYLSLRMNAKAMWSTHYDASNNYGRFTTHLATLAEGLEVNG